MTGFRFIHASDLHLGRRFANIPEPLDGNVRGRLMEARHGAIARLAAAATAQGAADILLAGDTFDTATPSPTVIRQTLAAMAEAGAIRWWLLPGNHDNLRDAEPLWDAIRREGPANVHAVTETAPVAVAPGVALLPCPVEWRSAGRDPTTAMVEMPSPEGALRIGLAHGGVADFGEDGAAIAPDRDRSAGLDFLALGDWHGRMQVGPRVHYSGTPEQDRFKHDRRGVCLAVELAGPGVIPQVEEVETGAFLWTEREVTLAPRQDAEEALAAVLPDGARRDTLLRIRAAGWTGLAERTRLQEAADRFGPEFAHFELRSDALGTQYDAGDLDEIDRGGALRLAADMLMAEAGDTARSEPDRTVATDALARLYAYTREAPR
ncbi:DNA repair exonuclease SbcCD nuclease subunit [Palleronia marisminoris]|uniref:Putative metallophosphoesterase YhaO n=1 Tax=Palleronia marisminoris TaxID=315423 RepID=A0A1Y5R934_9RHOB|nr:metallophosphoesterase [Palleronia marisminoris]SFG09274.1 DNA repair exonuclease SbcCD nuclease subunit [Palleronia marisminoris]SLN11932.1 putative metallophosphoesterase YhaO [Palleronia marisminoris]